MELEPIAVPIPEGERISGLSRSDIYRRLAAGELKAKKSGRRTLILYESLKQVMANLPDAKFTPPPKRKSDDLLAEIGDSL